jgi:hypothetical protein
MGHPDTTVRKLLDAMALMEKHLTAVLASRWSTTFYDDERIFDGEPIFDEDPNDPITKSIDVFGSSVASAYDDTFATTVCFVASSPSNDDDLLGMFGIFVLDHEQLDGKQTAQPRFDSTPCMESDSEENRQSLLVVNHFLKHGGCVDRRLLVQGRPTDRRAEAARGDLGRRHHVQHGAHWGRDEQLLSMAKMGTIHVIFARKFRYGTLMFSIWRWCLWTNRDVVPHPNRVMSIVDLHTEEASPGRMLVAKIRHICVTAKENFLSQLTLLELEVPYEQEKLDSMVDMFQKDISTNISWIPKANTRYAEEEEVLTTSPNRCLMNCFNLLQSCSN